MGLIRDELHKIVSVTGLSRHFVVIPYYGFVRSILGIDRSVFRRRTLAITQCRDDVTGTEDWFHDGRIWAMHGGWAVYCRLLEEGFDEGVAIKGDDVFDLFAYSRVDDGELEFCGDGED